ncbi:unnamed protein product, partial [Sphenostylis stenocarpa]
MESDGKLKKQKSHRTRDVGIDPDTHSQLIIIKTTSIASISNSQTFTQHIPMQNTYLIHSNITEFSMLPSFTYTSYSSSQLHNEKLIEKLSMVNSLKLQSSHLEGEGKEYPKNRVRK